MKILIYHAFLFLIYIQVIQGEVLSRNLQISLSAEKISVNVPVGGKLGDVRFEVTRQTDLGLDVSDDGISVSAEGAVGAGVSSGLGGVNASAAGNAGAGISSRDGFTVDAEGDAGTAVT
jgi:hypothetical protein